MMKRMANGDKGYEDTCSNYDDNDIDDNDYDDDDNDGYIEVQV